MEIFVSHDGEQLGPFSAEDVEAKINNGSLSRSDYAWTAGLDEWQPLSKIFANLSASAAMTDAAHKPATQAQLLQQSESLPVEKSSDSIGTKGSILKGVGSWVAGGLSLLVVIFLIGIILGWGARLAAWVEPWVQGLAGLALLILVPISLVLLVFRENTSLRRDRHLLCVVSSWSGALD